MESSNAPTYFDLRTVGNEAMEDCDYRAAFPIFMALRNSGDTQVLDSLGWMFERAEGCEKNLGCAARMFRMSADRGSEYGLIGLGDALADSGDLEGAKIAYEEGVSKGLIPSMSRLGIILTKKDNTTQAQQRGMEMLNFAAAKGHVLATRALLGFELAATSSIIKKLTIWSQIFWLSVSQVPGLIRDPRAERYL